MSVEPKMPRLSVLILIIESRAHLAERLEQVVAPKLLSAIPTANEMGASSNPPG
jgi:hypothetical protein